MADAQTPEASTNLAPLLTNVREKFKSQYGVNVEQLKTDKANILSRSTDNGPLQQRNLFNWSIEGTAFFSLVPDLEQINLQSVVSDQSLRPNLIEQNLREAIRLQQICLGLKHEYGELAKAYVETKLKSEEFFRLEDIHDLEVQAGLYQLPYLEALDTMRGLISAANELHQQQQVAANAISVNSNHKGGLASMEGKLAGSGNRAEGETISGYHSDMELSAWNCTLRETNSNIARNNADMAIAQRKSQYLLKDITYRSSRAAVSRQLAYAQLNENTRSGSILNYKERLTATALLFNLSLRQLIERTKLLQSGQQLYGLTPKMNSPKPGGILDEVCSYLADFQRLLSVYQTREKISLHSIVLSTKGKILDNLEKSGIATFLLSTQDFSPRSGLIRGVALEYTSAAPANALPISAVLRPPLTATPHAPSGTANSGIDLQFGRVMPFPNSTNLLSQFTDIFWNGKPEGSWQISVQPQLLHRTKATDILLYIWLGTAA